MRSEFWWFQLFGLLAAVIGYVFDAMIFGIDEASNLSPFSLVADFGLLLPVAAVTARRLHDVGKSGWWQMPAFLFYVVYLEGFVPASLYFSHMMLSGVAGLYGLALYLFLIKDSQPHTNKYGPNPKNPDMGEVFS